ncbi:MAG: V-type ATPase subunit [Spirochaetaceae bacterium]|nr:V-type ATPase subunit [Spirochaetaceae bacterium]
MASPIKRYAYINAKLKTRLSLVLSEDFFTRLIKTSNLAEATLMLKDTVFAPVEAVYARTGDLKMSEMELKKTEIALFQEIHRHVDKDLQEFVNSLLMQYEIENFKNVFRLWFDRWIRKRDISFVSGYILREPILFNYDKDAVIAASDDSLLINSLKGTPYLDVVSKYIEEVRSGQTMFPLEMALDLLFYNNLISHAKELNEKDRIIVERLIGVEIDLENITRLIRFKLFYHFTPLEIQKYVLSGGFRLNPDNLLTVYSSSGEAELLPALLGSGYGSVSSLASQSQSNIYKRMELVELVLEEILMSEVKKLMMGNPFSIGIMMSYFILKKHEIRRLLTILNGKNYGLTEERMMN